MKKYIVELEIEISQNWIDDGFSMNRERLSQIEYMVKENLLPYAVMDQEVKVKATKKQIKTDKKGR